MSNRMIGSSRNRRSQLMATASVLVLVGVTPVQAIAAGDDTDKPPFWIEMGWQFERGGGGFEAFKPPFTDSIVASGFTSPVGLEKALAWSYGADGKISYQAENSDWVFSAAIRYGRAHGHKSIHQQTPGERIKVIAFHTFTNYATPYYRNLSDIKATNQETHTILDFQAGRDVGLGLFGQNGTSTVSAGVRYAQIKFGSQANILAHTGIHYPGVVHFPTDAKYHTNQLHFSTDNEVRSFRGLGPTISWTASADIAGNPQDAELALNWGINAGLLFGKQKANGHHNSKTTVFHSSFINTAQPHRYVTGPVVPINRSRSVTVPNLGGFAAFSFDWSGAKINMGYRADIFFGALDGGIDSRKSETRGFYGPFASISIGLSPSDF